MYCSDCKVIYECEVSQGSGFIIQLHGISHGIGLEINMPVSAMAAILLCGETPLVNMQTSWFLLGEETGR